jgi:hypothetical protein
LVGRLCFHEVVLYHHLPHAVATPHLVSCRWVKSVIRRIPLHIWGK